MVRTQIQLTEEQVERLKKKAAEAGVSMAEVVRRSLDDYLCKGNSLTMEEKRQRSLAIAGKYASGQRDISTRHDEYLADIYQGIDP
jgi:hypothetical protein